MIQRRALTILRTNSRDFQTSTAAAIPISPQPRVRLTITRMM